LFYHDRPAGLGWRLLDYAAAMTMAAASVAGCGRPPQSQAPAAVSAPASTGAAAPVTPSPTPTGAASAGGRAAIDEVRAAAGGAALTALRSFELDGTSTMTGLKSPRQLKVLALFPQYFRQDEAPAPNATGQKFHTVIGMQDTVGWILGGRLGGDGASPDRTIAERAYTRAARQAMVGFLAGINAPWLVDSNHYTATLAGTVTAGPDRDAVIVVLDGPDGRGGRLLIDPNTHLPRRLIEPPQPGGRGPASIIDIIFTYSDFQPQDGLQLPHTIIRENGPNRTVWSISKYVLNPRLTPRNFLRMAR
jgi:hypothetical protein